MKSPILCFAVACVASVRGSFFDVFLTDSAHPVELVDKTIGASNLSTPGLQPINPLILMRQQDEPIIGAILEGFERSGVGAGPAGNASFAAQMTANNGPMSYT